nr:MAG TPA: hypothetical protein [Caudoviricetes sp.]
MSLHIAICRLPREAGGILTKPLKMGKYMQNLKEIRCQCCNKLLAKVGTMKHLEIKCSRCKTINHIN